MIASKKKHCKACQGELKDGDFIFVTDCEDTGCVFHFYCYQEREVSDLVVMESIKEGVPVSICPIHHNRCIKKFNIYRKPIESAEASV